VNTKKGANIWPAVLWIVLWIDNVQLDSAVALGIELRESAKALLK
jgi:hypothetical protein